MFHKTSLRLCGLIAPNMEAFGAIGSIAVLLGGMVGYRSRAEVLSDAAATNIEVDAGMGVTVSTSVLSEGLLTLMAF